MEGRRVVEEGKGGEGKRGKEEEGRGGGRERRRRGEGRRREGREGEEWGGEGRRRGGGDGRRREGRGGEGKGGGTRDGAHLAIQLHKAHLQVLLTLHCSSSLASFLCFCSCSLASSSYSLYWEWGGRGDEVGGQGKREKEEMVTGPHLHELRGNCHEVDLVNVDHPCSTLYPCERDFNLQLANEACSNNQRGFPRMMSLASSQWKSMVKLFNSYGHFPTA